MAPCEADDIRYRLLIRPKTITEDQITAAQIIKISQMSGISALPIKRSISKEQTLENTFYVEKLLELLRYLLEQQISYESSPPFAYSRILQCEKRITVIHNK